MAGGAVIAATAGQRQRRLQHVLDMFRLASATTPDAARALADLGLKPSKEIDELASAGVLCVGRPGASWYLDEAAYIKFRDARARLRLRVLLTLVLALLAILVGVLSAGIRATR